LAMRKLQFWTVILEMLKPIRRMFLFWFSILFVNFLQWYLGQLWFLISMSCDDFLHSIMSSVWSPNTLHVDLFRIAVFLIVTASCMIPLCSFSTFTHSLPIQARIGWKRYCFTLGKPPSEVETFFPIGNS
jgi:hypothetical protein